jgi:hypothetical protein
MNLQNYKEYSFANYKSAAEQTSKGFRLGDVVIVEKDWEGNEKKEIGIILQIRSEYEVRLDSEGNTPESQFRLATDEEIQKYRPNILEENWNKIKAQRWKS